MQSRIPDGNTEKRKSASTNMRRYTLSNELRYFKVALGNRSGASAARYRTSLLYFLVRVRTNAAFSESIENLWSGRVRSCGSFLHPNRQ